jgi:hypothetical protein
MLLLLVLFIHNPTGAYEWQQSKTFYEQLPSTAECAMGSNTQKRFSEVMQEAIRKDVYAGMVAHNAAEWKHLSDACSPSTSHDELETLPFSEWRSREALIPWFVSIVNTLWAMVATIVAGAIWIWVFRTISPNSTDPS